MRRLIGPMPGTKLSSRAGHLVADTPIPNAQLPARILFSSISLILLAALLGFLDPQEKHWLVIR